MSINQKRKAKNSILDETNIVIHRGKIRMIFNRSMGDAALCLKYASLNTPFRVRLGTFDDSDTSVKVNIRTGRLIQYKFVGMLTKMQENQSWVQIKGKGGIDFITFIPCIACLGACLIIASPNWSIEWFGFLYLSVMTANIVAGVLKFWADKQLIALADFIRGTL